MKIIKYLFLFLIIAFALSWFAFKNPGMDLFDTNESDVVIFSSPSNLKKYVKAIVGTPKPRNYLAPDMLNLVAKKIGEVFAKYCDEVEVLPYIVHGIEYKNIRCSFNPSLQKRIIVGAHYDVFGAGPGADDNASGVAGILELSRLFKEKGMAKEKRVDLVAFTLEEPPFFRSKDMGSYIFAKDLFDKKIKIEFMLALEMIGYYSESPGSQNYFLPWMSLFYGDKGNFAALVGSYQEFSLTRKIRKLFNSNSPIEIKTINTPKFIYGVDWSDHLNFWNFGYPAFMITDTAFFRHGNYHQKSDTPDKLDFSYMAGLIHGIYFGISSY